MLSLTSGSPPCGAWRQACWLGLQLSRESAGGQAHVIGKGIGILLVEGWLSGLPAEAAQGIVLAGVIPDLVGATR